MTRIHTDITVLYKRNGQESLSEISHQQYKKQNKYYTKENVLGCHYWREQIRGNKIMTLDSLPHTEVTI